MTNANLKQNEKYRSQLVTTYLSKTGSFRKLFGSLLIFTFTFGFFIALPFLSAISQERELNKKITAVDEEQGKLHEELRRLKAPNKGVKELKSMIKNGPSILRSYIQTISDNRPFNYPSSSDSCENLMDWSNSEQSIQQITIPRNSVANISSIAAQWSTPDEQLAHLKSEDACASRQRDEYLSCRIDRFVQYQLCEYEQQFSSEILKPLTALKNGNQPLFPQAQLEQQFSEVNTALRQRIAETPKFWHTIQGKGQMEVMLESEIKQFWKGLSKKLNLLTNKLNQKIKSARDAEKTLKERATQLGKQQKELQSRLSKIQSPIGNLPIGLIESVLIFPVMLAIGFGMATRSLLEQVRLRCCLAKAENEGGTDSDTLSSQELAQVAPLWIEPSHSKFWRSILLSIPLFTALICLVAIANNTLVAEITLLEQASVRPIVYGSLYLLSLLGFLISLQQISKAWRDLVSCTT